MDNTGRTTSARVVVLTPPGRAAVASVRVEGPGSIALAGRFFRAAGGKRLAGLPAGSIAFGHWAESGEEVVVCRRAGDAVEIHCHGGMMAVKTIVRSLADAGAVETPWSDWLRDRDVDEIVAEAGLALSEARTERTAAILLDQFAGALSRAVASIAADVGAGRAEAAAEKAAGLLSWEKLGRHLVQPWHVVLAGPPNAGKSSLINALMGFQRAIVFHRPGTTRDAVTADAAINGWPVKLADTAGLRRGAEALEQAGIDRARQLAGQADLLVLVFDSSAPWTPDNDLLIRSHPHAAVVHTKSDLPPHPAPRPPGLATSTVTGAGLPALEHELSRRLVPNPPPPGAAVPFTPRQIELLNRIRSGG